MTGIAPDLRDLLPPHQAHGEVDKRPISYLWVYDPQEAKVHVEDGKGDHPAHYPTHATMATHVTHPDRLEGYAYSIVGGWRITDAQHHRVEDPFVLRSVLAALRKQNPAPPLPAIRYHGDPAKHSPTS